MLSAVAIMISTGCAIAAFGGDKFYSILLWVAGMFLGYIQARFNQLDTERWERMVEESRKLAKSIKELKENEKQ